jgi:hypothetical protein
MSVFCLIGGGGMAWVLFVPLFLISGAASIRAAWRSDGEEAASLKNSLLIVISRWLQKRS